MLTLFNVPVKRMFVVALIVLMGCRESDKNSSLIFEELNESLERSNEIINSYSNGTLQSLKGKANDNVTTESITFWLKVADSIYTESQSIINFIEALKSNLKKNEIDIGPLTSVNLYEKLYLFKKAILQRNLSIQSVDKVISDFLGRELKSDTDFYKINFLNNDLPIKNAMLSKIENNVVRATSYMLSFCISQVSVVSSGNCEMYQPVAVINSNKFGIGDELTITAGLGKFVLRRNLSFEINGLTVMPNESGVGEYKMRIEKAPGKYKAPVKIKYSTPGGRDETLVKDIEYTVVE